MSQLPAGLQSWTDPLSLLDPELAHGLTPLVHVLESVVRRRDAVAEGADGVVDGYAGLVPRGRPENIALSEWLLADVVPDEFLRRAAERELLHLEPRRPDRRPRGRVVVLADVSPDVLGPARLVHLAAMVVLCRRAAHHNAAPALGLLGDEPARWLEGDLGALVTPWLRARTLHLEASPDDVTAREDELEPDDEVWVLTGERLAHELAQRPGGRRRVLAVRDGRWTDAQLSEMHCRLDGDAFELPLPPGPVAVRALRGGALRGSARRPPATPDQPVRELRWPSFPGAERRLVARGAEDDVLVTAGVAWGATPKLRRHRFAGPVIAAGTLGRRLVAVVLRDDRLVVRVVGKSLASVDRIDVALSRQGLPPEVVGLWVDGGLRPLHFSDGDLLLPGPDRWWRLSRDRMVEEAETEELAPSAALDAPRRAVRHQGRLWAGGAQVAGAPARVVFGPEPWFAVSDDGILWQTFVVERFRATPREAIAIGPGERVLGLYLEGDRSPRLAVTTEQGVLVRLVGAASVTTPTGLAGGVGPASLHPVLPWLAVQRDEVSVEVVDLLHQERRVVVRADP